MALLWSFRCYVSEKGIDEIRKEHDGFGVQTKNKFLSRLQMLARLPLDEWNENLYKSLHGNCAGLGEIRFLADRVQQRPLGFRSGAFEFTLLFWAREKGSKFVPASACEKALIRKAAVEKSRERSHALWLALE